MTKSILQILNRTANVSRCIKKEWICYFSQLFWGWEKSVVKLDSKICSFHCLHAHAPTCRVWERITGNSCAKGAVCERMLLDWPLKQKILNCTLYFLQLLTALTLLFTLNICTLVTLPKIFFFCLHHTQHHTQRQLRMYSFKQICTYLYMFLTFSHSKQLR